MSSGREDFEFIVSWIIDENEKGYANSPNDRGGATKYGISLRYLQSRQTPDEQKANPVTEKTILNLTKEEAIEIYYNDFWLPFKFDQVCKVDYEVAKKVFDMAINMGPASAIKIMQRAINDNYNNDTKIIVDGIIGKITLQDLNDISVDHDMKPFFIDRINKFAMQHYCSIVSNNSSQLPNLMGWYNRMAKMW